MSILVNEEKQYCILCRGELINLSNEINIHPIPCQQELDNFIPEKISSEFPDFFYRLTNFKLSPIQEQMFLFVEGQTNAYYSARGIGKTLFLLVYTIYKALETGNQYGSVFHNGNMDNVANRVLKKMFLNLTEDEREKLDIITEVSPSGRIRTVRKDPKVDTFSDYEIRLVGYFPTQLYEDFKQIEYSGVRFNSGEWHLIFDSSY